MFAIFRLFGGLSVTQNRLPAARRQCRDPLQFAAGRYLGAFQRRGDWRTWDRQKGHRQWKIRYVLRKYLTVLIFFQRNSSICNCSVRARVWKVIFHVSFDNSGGSSGTTGLVGTFFDDRSASNLSCDSKSEGHPTMVDCKLRNDVLFLEASPHSWTIFQLLTCRPLTRSLGAFRLECTSSYTV